MLCITDYSKHGEVIAVKKGLPVGVPEWSIYGIIELTIILSIEGFIECCSLGIYEWFPEKDTERPLLELEDNIKYDDELLTIVGVCLSEHQWSVEGITEGTMLPS